MKRLFAVLVGFGLVALLGLPAGAVPPPPDEVSSQCATIQGGTITDAEGNVIGTGFDEFGYNYQARMFVGPFDGYDRKLGNDTSSYADDQLVMKWSEPWLANVDCDGDHKLDRGLVQNEVGGISLGWLTNHLSGDYEDGTQYVNFAKIVWTGPGSPLWGQYTVIEEVNNDPSTDQHGLQLKVGSPGFGVNDGWTQLG